MRLSTYPREKEKTLSLLAFDTSNPICCQRVLSDEEVRPILCKCELIHDHVVLRCQWKHKEVFISHNINRIHLISSYYVSLIPLEGARGLTQRDGISSYKESACRQTGSITVISARRPCGRFRTTFHILQLFPSVEQTTNWARHEWKREAKVALLFTLGICSPHSTKLNTQLYHTGEGGGKFLVLLLKRGLRTLTFWGLGQRLE